MKFLLLLFVVVFWGNNLFSQNNKPKLIVQITVDQLRGDLPDKYMKNMNESIEGMQIAYEVEPKDRALTLSNYFNTKPPSGANGNVLLEVIQQLNK